MSELQIDFAGELIEVHPDACLSFGRDAHLEVDTNPFLHRRVGIFRQRNGEWWLSNVGTAIAIEICDEGSPSRMTIAPGACTPMPFQTAVVRFQAGPSVYELIVDQPHSTSFGQIEDVFDASPMKGLATVPLNYEQRLLLVALAELRLRDCGESSIPPNRTVASLLGWTTTKFNRKLDNLCAKFDRLGVSGLKGSSSGLASKRRERLVEHVLTIGLITRNDLELLDSFDR